jgi:hypothetical protein
MRRADLGCIWTNDQINREVAGQIFGAPAAGLSFSEPHGVLWELLDLLWPRANFIQVWERVDG